MPHKRKKRSPESHHSSQGQPGRGGPAKGRTHTGVLLIKRGRAVAMSDLPGVPPTVIPHHDMGKAKSGDRVVFEITGKLRGRVTKVFDGRETFKHELGGFPLKFNLSPEFPPEVIAEAEASLSLPEQGHRADARRDFCVTIDPEDARDFDDAVSVTRGPGEYLLGVHIADVSHYVRPGSALDGEALARATSVYLPWAVVPMLPNILSDDACSLVEGKERRAMTCWLRFNDRGEVQDARVERSMIINKKRLHYASAQAILDGGPAEERLRTTLFTLSELASLLRKRRLEAGSLDFDLPETKISFGADGWPSGVVKKQRMETNSLIEECMLAANRAVAALISRGGKPAIFRIHESPGPDDVGEIISLIRQNGLPWKGPFGPAACQEIVRRVKGTPQERQIQSLLLRSLPKARYSETNAGHFGLAFELYTHFTSPIRRYPDLIVHRLLSPARGEKPVDRPILHRMADHCSLMEENALKAERDGTSLASCAFMLDKLGQEFDGAVTGVIAAGVFIELSPLPVDGMLHVSRLTDDYYVFDPLSLSLKGRRTGRQFKMGDRVRVRLAEVNLPLRRIDLTAIFTPRSAPETGGRRAYHR